MKRSEPKLLRLAGGARLAYALHGGGPRKAIFFHGHPGSRHQGEFLHEAALAHGIEVAAFDRPGFGHSDLAPGAPRLDLAAEVGALATHLGWDRFHLVAVSGGAPYALHTAQGLGARALSVQLVCGLGPLHEPRFRRRFPRGPYGALRLASVLPAPVLAPLLFALQKSVRAGGGPRPPFLSSGDFEILRSPAVMPGLRASLEAAFRQGARGVKRELKAFLSPWQLDYAAFPCPVAFWHGEDDRLVPCDFSRWLQARFPGAQLRIFPGEGHYTLPLLRAAEILAAIP